MDQEPQAPTLERPQVLRIHDGKLYLIEPVCDPATKRWRDVVREVYRLERLEDDGR